MAADQSNMLPTHTAGIIIIGDEILKGHTQDTNSHFISKRLWALGVKVCKISVIPDRESAIVEEVREFSEKFNFVITTGGIGPTHDDVTMSSIAKAFNEELELNEDLKHVVAKLYKEDVSSLNSSHLKMAKLPPSGKLIFPKSGMRSPFPVLSVRNVFIFPGVPGLVYKGFQIIEPLLAHPEVKKFHLCKIFLAVDETAVAHVLDDVDEKFKETVQLGSYPECTSSGWHVKLTLESESEGQLREACQYLQSKLPQDSILRMEGLGLSQTSEDANPSSESSTPTQTSSPEVHNIQALLSPNDKTSVSSCVKGAWSVIQQSMQQYFIDELCISFNGGKDCTVLLHILYAAIAERVSKVPKINALYVQHDSPFPEAEKFVEETTKRYNLNLICMKGKIKEALLNLKTSHPNIKAILMGTRRHDPFTEKLHTFSMTDPGWPEYMRINPILDWNHKDVWSFLLHCKIPYCSLYDNGYTSLGSSHNTKPNPMLKVEGSSSEYKPAYLLEDDHHERAGRL